MTNFNNSTHPTTGDLSLPSARTSLPCTGDWRPSLNEDQVAELQQRAESEGNQKRPSPKNSASAAKRSTNTYTVYETPPQLKTRSAGLPTGCDSTTTGRPFRISYRSSVTPLMERLYCELGLTLLHISLLCGVGTTGVKGRLVLHSIALRGRGPSPCTRRHIQR
jgi:hypothetical protein